MNRNLFLSMIALAFAPAFCAVADNAVVPSNGNATELAGGQEGPFGGTAARRFMIVMDARAFSGIPVGSTLTGIRFRLDSSNAVAWPPSNVTITDYELRISAAATSAATASSTYATNISGPQTLVKDGSLNFVASSYSAAGSPRAFGPVINFDTPYIYTGGSLCLDFNHTGVGAITTGFADAEPSGATNFVRGLYATNRSAASGVLTSTPVIRFEYTPPTNKVLPESLASTAGAGSQTGPIGGTLERRYLFNIDAAALGIPAGSLLHGLSFRLDEISADPWPPQHAQFSPYNVRIGPGVATSAMSTTFANNFTSQVLVYDGSLELNEHIFPNDATSPTPEQFGVHIPFSAPYLYFGGNLSIDIRYVQPGLVVTGSMDATSPGDFASTGMRGLSSVGSIFAVTGTLTSAPVTRLFFTPGPSPDLATGVTKVFVIDDFASEHGPSGLNTPIQTTARTYQIVAAEDQFDTLGLGSRFVGHATRAFHTQPQWPGVASNFGSYSVTLSRSPNTPATISDTFSANTDLDSVVARSGALSIPANSFEPLGTGPAAPFTFTIPYTSSYAYNGGPLSILIRHTGGSVSPIFLDSLQTTDPRYGVKAAARLADGNASLVGTTFSAALLRFDVDAATTIPRSAPDTSAGNVAGLLNTSDYTIQTIISAGELRDIPVGSLIDELWLRTTSTARPVADALTTDFELSLSTASNRPTAMSTTFANNEGPDLVRVFDGPLAFPAGAFPSVGMDRYARVVRFQRAFVYQGGDLCVTIRHRGFSSDCIDAPIPAASDRGRSMFVTSFNAASGAVLGSAEPRYFSMRFAYTPSVCTPNALATTEGVNGLLNLGSPSTVQFIVPASQLSTVDVGSAITGISFRNSSSGGGDSFPTSASNYTRFDVSIAPTSVAPNAMSNTFASNIGPGEIVVRDGPLAAPQYAFPASGEPSVPSEFAWFIPFDRAFIYQGGNICVTIRTQGALPGNTFFDTDTDTPSARSGMKLSGAGPDALVADTTWGGFVTRFAFTARAFCPWDLNNDGLVTDDDFVLFLSAYNILDCTDGSMTLGCPSDFNFDRLVDDLDFQAFLLPYNDLICP